MKANSIFTLLTFGLVLLVGCNGHNETVSPQAPPLGTPFEIRDYDYATNHFFVDTLYRRLYESYYQSDIPTSHPLSQIVEEEVWVSRRGPSRPGVRQGIAYVSLPPRPVRGYDDSLRSRMQVPGQIESEIFSRIGRNEYQMTAGGYVGVVSFTVGFPDDGVIGIAYRRGDGEQFGEFHWEHDSSTPIILKMVKPRNLMSNGPAYPVAWDQLLKNIYAIGPGVVNVSELGFALNVTFASSGSVSTNQVAFQPLLRVLGLDRFNLDRTPAPTGDGVFDFLPGITIDQEAGEIILPSLRPFDGGIREYFTRQGLPLPETSYFSPGIYDAVKTVARTSPRHYTISGRAR